MHSLQNLNKLVVRINWNEGSSLIKPLLTRKGICLNLSSCCWPSLPSLGNLFFSKLSQPCSTTSCSHLNWRNHERVAIMPTSVSSGDYEGKVSHYSPPTSSPENLLQQITISFSGARSKSEGKNTSLSLSLTTDEHVQHYHYNYYCKTIADEIEGQLTLLQWTTRGCALCACRRASSLSLISSSPSALRFCFNLVNRQCTNLPVEMAKLSAELPTRRTEDSKRCEGRRRRWRYTARADEVVQLAPVANINCRHWPSRRQMLSLLYSPYATDNWQKRPTQTHTASVLTNNDNSSASYLLVVHFYYNTSQLN